MKNIFKSFKNVWRIIECDYESGTVAIEYQELKSGAIAIRLEGEYDPQELVALADCLIKLSKPVRPPAPPRKGEKK